MAIAIHCPCGERFSVPEGAVGGGAVCSVCGGHQGEPLLNLCRQAGQVVRLILLDPAGVWSQKAPAIEIALAC